MTGETNGQLGNEHDAKSPDSRRGQSSEEQNDRLAAEQADDRHPHDPVPAQRSPLDGIPVKELPFGARQIGEELFCVKKMGSRPYCHFCGDLKNVVALVGVDSEGNPRRACSTCVDSCSVGEIDSTRYRFIMACFGLLS